VLWLCSRQLKMLQLHKVLQHFSFRQLQQIRAI
jgi:hypothetical protein